MGVVRVWPQNGVPVYSEKVSSFGSDDGARFSCSLKLDPGTSRRDICWDNAVAGCFFSSLEKERTRNRP